MFSRQSVPLHGCTIADVTSVIGKFLFGPSVEDIGRGVPVICRSNARFVFGHVSLQSTSRALQPAQAWSERRASYCLAAYSNLRIMRNFGQFVPYSDADRRIRSWQHKARAALPQRRSSNASSLGGQNSAWIPQICATFQGDNLRRHF